MADEMVDGPVVVMHVAVTQLEENFGVDKIDVIAEACLAKSFVYIFLGGSQGFEACHRKMLRLREASQAHFQWA